jgi:sRNA-binding regulator protein Hfq
MSLGSYVLYLRALRGGITPREVAAEIGMPEHYIHAIELEKHVGDADSRAKLADYFELRIDDFAELARSSHSKFLEALKKERRPQVGFLLMNGETLLGTVDGADSSIVKIVEVNTGIKTILQRHAIKKWWWLTKPQGSMRDRDGKPGGVREGRPGGGRPPQGDRRPPGGGRPPQGDRRPPGGGGFGDRRPPGGGGFGDRRPPGGGNFRDNPREGGNYRGGNFRDNNGNQRDGGNFRDRNDRNNY